jgi:hypothetical protein
VVRDTDERSPRLTLRRSVLRRDLVPDQLSPGTFFATMVSRVLDNCPITFHTEARRRRGQPSVP